MSEERRRVSFIGMPHMPYFDHFGLIVYDAFGSHCYLVGSALVRPDYRDVDVRLILADDDFAAEFGEQTDWRSNPKLAAVNMAWSALGAKITGLPVDFQIDQMTEANRDHSGQRHALGLRARSRRAA